MTGLLPTRRTLLAAALAAPMLPGVRLFAAPASDSKLLIVFLRGAYDSASVLVPTSSSFYAEARPTLAIPKSGKGAAVALDGDWGLSPALAEALMPFWQRRELAFIPFAGTPDLSRSHFETQDTIEMGLSPTAKRDPSSGFMNRLAVELTGVSPMAFTDRLPLSFRGKMPVPNVALSSAGKRGADPRSAALLARMYAGDQALGAQVAQGYAAGREVSQALANEMATSGRDAVSASGFEGAASRIGTVMRGKTNLAFVDVGGWDTHVAQGGSLDFRLGVLGRGLASFARAIGPDWSRTTVVVISEFGRTLRENGAKGTDHGHGTAFWVLGGGVKGGRIAGAQVKVSRATLNQDRDFPVLNEVRSVLGGIFKRQYGLDAARLARIFPGAEPRDLGLL